MTPKLLDLERKASEQTFNEYDAAEYERLLRLDAGIRTQAKKKCRPFLTGRVTYSNVIGKDQKIIHLWDIVIARRQGRRRYTRAIRRLMIQTGITAALQLSLPAAEIAQAASLKQYQCDKKRADQLYLNFQKKVCARRAAKLQTSIKAQEKIFHNNRKQSGAFQKINRILQRKQRHSITTVEYTTPDNEAHHTCYSKDKIEAACATKGQRRFTQSAETPFLQGSLLRDLGYLATQSTVDCILHETYQCSDDVDQYTQEFIDQLFIPDSISNCPMINGHVTTSAHIKG